MLWFATCLTRDQSPRGYSSIMSNSRLPSIFNGNILLGYLYSGWFDYCIPSVPMRLPQ